MTDSPSVTLRWEIDDPHLKFATGKVESGVFESGGFKWSITAEREIPSGRSCFSLSCDSGRSLPWRCDTEMDMHQCSVDGPDKAWSKYRVEFTKTSSVFSVILRWFWSELTTQGFIINRKVVFEFVINIISSNGGIPIADPSKFATSNRMSNVILKIEGERIHVSKELLSIHSPVFKCLFFGDFAENGKEEVEIKDVVFEEFVNLLHVLYLDCPAINDATVAHLLALADRFQIENVRKSAEEHLLSSNMNTSAKLLLADMFKLNDLKENCLRNCTTAQEIRQLKMTKEYANFSDAMKAAILDKSMELI